MDGEVWIIHRQGAVAAGARADAGVPLLSLALEGPAGSSDLEATPYVVARGLEEIEEDTLRDLVRDALRESERPKPPKRRSRPAKNRREKPK